VRREAVSDAVALSLTDLITLRLAEQAASEKQRKIKQNETIKQVRTK
jgi:hypothetical protein